MKTAYILLIIVFLIPFVVIAEEGNKDPLAPSQRETLIQKFKYWWNKPSPSGRLPGRVRGPMRPGDMMLFPPTLEDEVRTREQLGRNGRDNDIMVIPNLRPNSRLQNEFDNTDWEGRVKKKRISEFTLRELNYMRTRYPDMHEKLVSEAVANGAIDQFGQTNVNYVRMFGSNHFNELIQRLKLQGKPTQFEEEWVIDPRGSHCDKSLETIATK